MQIPKTLQRVAIVFLFIGGFFVAFPRPALAYVDPGTGSYVLQVVIAGIAAAGFGLRIFWTRFKAFFSKSELKSTTEEDNE